MALTEKAAHSRWQARKDGLPDLVRGEHNTLVTPASVLFPHPEPCAIERFPSAYTLGLDDIAKFLRGRGRSRHVGMHAAAMRATARDDAPTAR